MEKETLTTEMTPDMPEAEAPETPEGGLGQALAGFAKAIGQMVRGLLIFLLRLIPILLWAAAVLFWGYRLYRLLQTVIGIYAPDGRTVPLVAWIAIVLLTNLPAIAANIYRSREGDRKDKFFRFGGVVFGMGLADLGAQTSLHALTLYAPLLALSLPHLFLGAGMVFTKWPHANAQTMQKGGAS